MAMLVTATVASASHSWGKYHWGRTSNPFPVKLVDSLTINWDNYLGVASRDWSLDSALWTSVLDTQVVTGPDDSDTRKNCSAVLGKVRVCNAEYGNNGWLGLAQIWISPTSAHWPGRGQVERLVLQF